MRTVALASLVAMPAAVAFVAPRAPPATRLTPRMAITAGEDLEAGATPPTGYFDPLGLSKASTGDFRKWRENELKHGRIAMLASVGFLVQERFHPLFGLKKEDIPFAITHFQTVAQRAPWFVPALILGIALAEGAQIRRGFEDPDEVPPQGIASIKEEYITGDLGLDPFNLKEDERAFMNYRNKELNNGRLAMISIIGMWVQELATHKPVFAPFPPGGDAAPF